MLDLRDTITYRKQSIHIIKPTGKQVDETILCEIDILKMNELTKSIVEPIINIAIHDICGIGETREDALKDLLRELDNFVTLATNYQSAVHMEIERILTTDIDGPKPEEGVEF